MRARSEGVRGSADARNPRRLRGRLLRWYAKNRRDLPWRDTADPYAVWVSEVMLQQTRVAAMLPHYRRFLARFPDPARLARASEDEVLAAWSGLGYYRRARSLQAGARIVLERHGGRIPSEPDELLALPGIGRYTAGAIASIAFGRREPVLDGNVRRVLARSFAIDGKRLGQSVEERRLWALATALVDGPHPGELNQALMELGALVCTPRRPDCPACPLRTECLALARGRPEAYPAPRPSPRTESVRVAVGWITRGDAVLLERPQHGDPLRGAWDLPAVVIESDADPGAAVSTHLARRHGVRVAAVSSDLSLRHTILHRRLALEVASGRARSAGRGCEHVRWWTAEEIAEGPVSGATHKVLRAIGKAPRES